LKNWVQPVNKTTGAVYSEIANSRRCANAVLDLQFNYMKKAYRISKAFVAIFSLCLVINSLASAQNTAATTPLPAERITGKVDEYMNAAFRVDGFSGTILVARDGKPIVSKGYGMANIELGVPNKPDNIFRLGSVTKQFTSMAVMILQERGKLSVNDPICKYFADCPEAWKPITIRNLLTHTSGITNYTEFKDFAQTTILPTATGDMVARLEKEPLEFAPGEKFSYSNSGYYLLGVVIEKASGKTYADFLQENIFTPLGMKQTGYDDSLRIIMNRAEGYQRQAGKIINAPYMDMSVPYAAGSLYSNTGDLLIWDQALYTDKLVSQKSLDEIFTPFKSGYGYGWGIGKRFEHRQISHGGGIYGFATEVSRFPDDRVTVIVLSNFQGAPAGLIANNLAAIVFGAPYEIPKERKEIALDPKVLEKYVGEYQIGTNIVIAVSLENGKLVGQLGGQTKFVLLPVSETQFFSEDVNAQITFILSSEGNVTGFTLNQGGGNTPAKKIK
jgi:CubicO group peptidase (beta-lactamase class C family)